MRSPENKKRSTQTEGYHNMPVVGQSTGHKVSKLIAAGMNAVLDGCEGLVPGYGALSGVATGFVHESVTQGRSRIVLFFQGRSRIVLL